MARQLPKPAVPYGSWPIFVEAAIDWGIKYMDPIQLGFYTQNISKDVLEAFARTGDPDEAPIRPSGGINCAAMPWLAQQGFRPEPEEFPPSLLFATGHFHHNIIYAALHSALSKTAFRVLDETEIKTMPDWWPTDPTHFKQTGHRDLFLEQLEDGWLAPQLSKTATFDIKTKHGLGMMQIAKSSYEILLENDTFGNGAQLSVYESDPNADGYVIYSNREVPSKWAKTPQIRCRKILAQDLDEIREQVKHRLTTETFEPELWLKWQARKFKGYAPCRTHCKWKDSCAVVRGEQGFAPQCDD